MVTTFIQLNLSPYIKALEIYPSCFYKVSCTTKHMEVATALLNKHASWVQV